MDAEKGQSSYEEPRPCFGLLMLLFLGGARGKPAALGIAVTSALIPVILDESCQIGRRWGGGGGGAYVVANHLEVPL